MRNELRLCVVVFALVVAIGCGAADQSPPSSSAGSGSAAPADAATNEPIITTMPMDVPSGTELILTLETAVSSETAKPDQPVRATLAKPVVVAGMETIPAGALVTGAVVSAERSVKVKGRVTIALRFNEVTVMNKPYRITTARIAREAEATKGEEATIPAGATLRTTITETVRVTMPM